MQQPIQVPLEDARLPRDGEVKFEQAFHRDYRACTCAMPMVSRRWNEALGTFVTIRMCCLARAVEELTGQKLYEVEHFPPRWEWDCNARKLREYPDGTKEETIQGPPPRWLRERMEAKGIPIKNMEVL